MTRLLDPRQLSQAISEIYDCAIDPSQWQRVLNTLRCDLNFANAAMSLNDLPSGDVLLNITDGIEEPWLSRMPDYYSDVVDLWGGIENFLKQPADQPMVLSRVNPEHRSPSNRYYSEWGRPQGLVDVLALPLARDTGSLGTLALTKHESMGLIDDGDIEAARLLLPHLQRAVAISRLLDIRTLTASTFATVIDTVTAAILLVGTGLNLVHANTAARHMIADGSLLRLRTGHLELSSHAAQKALAVAVARVAESESGIDARGLGVPMRTEAGAAFVLHVLPLRVGALRPGLAPGRAGAIAAIFIAPARAPRPTSASALSALFELTPRETRVLELIVAGRSNAEIARALGVGLSTVRTHLLQLFDKMGVHRQAELVAFASSFMLPLET